VGKFLAGGRQLRFDGIEHIRYPILSNGPERKGILSANKEKRASS